MQGRCRLVDARLSLCPCLRCFGWEQQFRKAPPPRCCRSLLCNSRFERHDFPHVSAFEIEAFGRFDVASVHQAHAQGRGADFSWVAFVRPESNEVDSPIPRRAKRSVTAEETWNHIVWTARDLGVGLISFTNPGSSGTWRVHEEARANSRPNRDLLIRNALR